MGPGNEQWPVLRFTIAPLYSKSKKVNGPVSTLKEIMHNILEIFNWSAVVRPGTKGGGGGGGDTPLGLSNGRQNPEKSNPNRQIANKRHQIRVNSVWFLTLVGNFRKNSDVSRQNCVLHPPQRRHLAPGLAVGTVFCVCHGPVFQEKDPTWTRPSLAHREGVGTRFEKDWYKLNVIYDPVSEEDKIIFGPDELVH